MVVRFGKAYKQNEIVLFKKFTKIKSFQFESFKLIVLWTMIDEVFDEKFPLENEDLPIQWNFMT